MEDELTLTHDEAATLRLALESARADATAFGEISDIPKVLARAKRYADFMCGGMMPAQLAGSLAKLVAG